MASKFSSVGMAGWLLLVSLLLGAALSVKGAVSCGSVVSSLSPCIPYLRNGGALPPPCCAGVKKINTNSKTTPDRQAVCGCLKTASASISGLNPGRVQGLPSACGVSIPYTISPSTDCTKVK